MAEKKACVLVVGENPEGCSEMAALLAGETDRVRIASGFAAGLDAARKGIFDVVVLCAKEEDSPQAEIVRAARARNSEARIVRLEPGDPANTKTLLDRALGQLRTEHPIGYANASFRSLFNAVFDSVLLIDAASETVALANTAAAKALRYTDEEIHGASVWQLIPAHGRERFRKMLQRVTSEGNVSAKDLVLRRKDGTQLQCQCSASLTGELPQKMIQVVFRDVTEKKRLIGNLAEASQSAPLREIVSGIVHELNNPLAAVLGYAQLSLTATSRKKLDEYLQTIHQQASRCQSIVKRLASFAPPPQLHRETTDLNTVVEEVASLFDCGLSPSNVEVRLQLCPSPLIVSADRGQIQQALLNVIKNAAEAISSDARGVISIETQRCGQEAVATVSDNGPGVAESIRERIFDPFFGTKPHRMGLGLSISRSILRANQGEIDVLQKTGQGAAFAIRLPLVKRRRGRDAASHY